MFSPKILGAISLFVSRITKQGKLGTHIHISVHPKNHTNFISHYHIPSSFLYIIRGVNMKTRIIAILIVLAFMCIVLPNNNPFVEQARGDNLAGDLDQLPENEELLNLSGGFGRPMYEKNNTLVYAVTDGNQNAADFFNGEHTGARIASGWITVDFPYSMRITRIDWS